MAGSQEILDGLRRLEETLYQRLSAELAAFRLEVNRRLDAIEVRLDRLETENQMIMVALRRLEETLAQDRSERAELRRDIVALRGKLSEVDVRITEIETKPNQ
jgi:chromosome segregation ATPase